MSKASAFVAVHSTDEHNKLIGDSSIILSKQSGEKSRLRVQRIKKMLAWSFAGVIIGVIGLGVVSFAGFPGFPLHASCHVDWTFGKSCEDVQGSLRNQIEKWTTADNCGTGQKCLYKLLTYNTTFLGATHETPVKHYVDDVSFTFTPTKEGFCFVHGFSTSQVWYAVLDYGTNYCNLKNLVEGANLAVEDPKYNESTRDAICTQYSSAECDKY